MTKTDLEKEKSRVCEMVESIKLMRTLRIPPAKLSPFTHAIEALIQLRLHLGYEIAEAPAETALKVCVSCGGTLHSTTCEFNL